MPSPGSVSERTAIYSAFTTPGVMVSQSRWTAQLKRSSNHFRRTLPYAASGSEYPKIPCWARRTSASCTQGGDAKSISATHKGSTSAGFPRHAGSYLMLQELLLSITRSKSYFIYHYLNACLRSAIKSSGASSPTDRRNKHSSMPRALRSLSGRSAWVCSIG